MKHFQSTLPLALMTLALIMSGLNASAQLGGMLKKAKNSVSGKKEDDSKLLEELEAQKYKLAPVEDNGMTNEFHTANVGKIVFASAAIPKGETSDANFKASFELGENIYSRVYLAKSLINESKSIGHVGVMASDFKVRMTVEGKTFNMLAPTKRDDNDKNPTNGYPVSQVALNNEAFEKWTTFQIGISPGEAGYPSMETRDFFYRMFQLPAGTHNVKIEVVYNIPEDEVSKQYHDSPDEGRKWTTKFGAEKVLAVGGFSILVTEAGKIKAGKKTCPKLDWLSGPSKIVPNGLAMISKEKQEGETILKVVEYGSDWTYNRNDFGVILNRTLLARALVQDSKTKLCFISEITYSEENISSGGSKYGITMFSRSGEFSVPGEDGLFVRECTGL
jgi:hypothetical protein